jgi:biopolymer transport protein ExbB
MKIWHTLFLTFPFGLMLQAQEPNYEVAAKSIESDLKMELQALAELREDIAKERPELAQETERIASELRDKRRRSQLAGQERDALIHDLASLSSEVRSWRDESVYIENLLSDFRKNLEMQMSVTEAESVRPLLLSAEQRGTTDGLESRLDLLEATIERLGQMTDPRSLKGNALDPEGVQKKGTFVEAGPISWFVADDKSTAGLVIENKDLRPQVIEQTLSANAILELAEGKDVSMLFDPTMGMAEALNKGGGSVLAHIKKGGFWIYPILIIALVATLAALFKWLQLLRIRAIRPSVLRKVINEVSKGNLDEAKSLVGRRSHPAYKALRRAIEIESKSPEDVEEALYEEYLSAQPKLESGLSWIAIAAATAPLLGLLGTVTGMIHTFKLINVFGTGDAKSLSSGISEALVTTEFGLVVAIPALIMHALLSRKISGILSATEMASIAYVNGLKVSQKPKTKS